VSPAPISTPSSAKTTAASGCMSASIGQIASARSITAGSEVNARGKVPASASSSAAKRQPATSDQPIARAATARAPAASSAPSPRPTSTCAAIAIASRTSAMKVKRFIAIWWAPSEASPIRAMTALAVAKATSSAAERTKSSPEMRVSGASSARCGRRLLAGWRTSSHANVPPIAACAITVPAAEPSRPQPSP
jgi:hypothetical protein